MLVIENTLQDSSNLVARRTGVVSTSQTASPNRTTLPPLASTLRNQSPTPKSPTTTNTNTTSPRRNKLLLSKIPPSTLRSSHATTVNLPPPPPDRKQLAMDLLSHGHARGFIDYMYFSHRQELDRVRPSDASLLARHVDPERYQGVAPFPQDHLVPLHMHLTAASQADARGDVAGEYHAYAALGEYFEAASELVEAASCYETCVRLARQGTWSVAEGEAEARLGAVLQRHGDRASSIQHHERHVELTAVAAPVDKVVEAYGALAEAYTLRADELEKLGDLLGALECVGRLAETEWAANRLVEHAAALERMAHLHASLGQEEEAMALLTRGIELMELTAQQDESEGKLHEEGLRMRAVAKMHLALGQCRDRRGESELAMRHLRTYLSLVPESNQSQEEIALTGEACVRLGKLLYERGAFSDAATFFAQGYQAAKAGKKGRLAELARINVGMARAADAEHQYRAMIQDGNVDGVLTWRLEGLGKEMGGEA